MTDASRIPYAPATPGDWTQHPADVAQALDELVSASGGGGIQESDFAGFGLMVRTGSGTFATRSISAGSGISVTNGNGVSANPQVNVSAANSVDVSKGSVELVNDSGAPGNNKVYGTDGSGTRGWQDATLAPTAGHYYAASASGTFTTTLTTVPFDTATTALANISLSSGEFTASADMTVVLTASLSANQNGTSTTATWYALLEVDTGSGFAEVQYARTGSVNTNAVHDIASGGMSCVLALTSGDVFRIRGARASGSATFEWRNLGYCHITLLRIA